MDEDVIKKIEDISDNEDHSNIDSDIDYIAHMREVISKMPYSRSRCILRAVHESNQEEEIEKLSQENKDNKMEFEQKSDQY